MSSELLLAFSRSFLDHGETLLTTQDFSPSIDIPLPQLSKLANQEGKHQRV
jgi:hypothetical protein